LVSHHCSLSLRHLPAIFNSPTVSYYYYYYYYYYYSLGAKCLESKLADFPNGTRSTFLEGDLVKALVQVDGV